MSETGSFWERTRRAADKVVAAAGNLVEQAGRSIKEKSLKLRIDEQYEKLGEIVYRDLHVEEDLEDEKLAVIAAIDALFDELTLLNGEENSAEEEADADGEEDPE